MNKKGFALAERLIVTVFVMTIFTFIFSSFYPLIAKYEKHENYDDIDSKYIAHYIRKQITKNKKDAIFTLNECGNTCKIIYNKNSSDTTNNNRCNNYFVDTNPTSLSFCHEFPKLADIEAIYLTAYNITNFKNKIKDDNSYSRGFIEYVDSLPVQNKANYYRIILIINKDTARDNYAYSTIEVKR